MSTDLQIRGDSRRRQLEASETYARQHGLDLVPDFKLEDIGVSAFKGANLATGQLGRFLEAVRAGKIDPGSYLLVESLDRLSRQAILQSQAVFLEIVNAGINIVTLADNHVYESGKTNLQDLIYSLVIMSRAHEESLTKSLRVSAAWTAKRRNVEDRKLTGLCPAWLSLSEDRKTFEVREDRAAIVRGMFEDCVAGVGSFTIAKRLNGVPVEPFGRSNGWQPSYVTKTLQSRSVLGEFQPYRLEAGKRVPAGPPISDYFPGIVTEGLFNRAQQMRAQRRTGAGGRRGAQISNLFSRIAKCGYCGAPMHFVNKGSPPKGGAYLVCDKSRRGLGCEKTAWRYSDFETSFLTFVREIDLESVVRGTDEAKERSALEQKIQSVEGKIVELKARRESTYNLIDGNTPSAFIKQKLADIEGLLVAAELESKELQQARDSKQAEAGRVYESKEKIKGLISSLQANGQNDVFTLRTQIAARLGALVQTLQLLPGGLAPKKRSTIRMLQEPTFGDSTNEGGVPDALVNFFESQLLDRRSHRRGFLVGFRDGTVRIVFPDDSDPATLDEQVYRDERNLIREDSTGATTTLFGASR